MKGYGFSVLCATLAAMGPHLVHAYPSAPHFSSATNILDCSACHSTMNAQGPSLTNAATNVTLCQSCHNASGQASGMPINNSDKATPGQAGTSHAFDVSPENAACGAQTPTGSALQARLIDGQIVCSTCHDQHTASASMGGTPRVSSAVRITALGSSGSLTSGGTYSGSYGEWYLLEIQTAGSETSATFKYSKDSGTTWTASDLMAGPAVPLESGVFVAFGSGSYVEGERWQFYASWPFLRAALDSGDNTSGSRFCRDCHRSWAMDHSALETYDGSYKSHPVGVAMNANGRAYDRAVPRDGNGAEQGSAGSDSNPTNDLELDSTGRIQCLSCHAPHFADSVTLTSGGSF